MDTLFFRLSLLLFVLGLAGCTSLSSSSNQFGQYTVKAGDGCYDITEKLCNAGADWKQDICDSGSVCSNLQIGQVIDYDCSGKGAHCSGGSPTPPPVVPTPPPAPISPTPAPTGFAFGSYATNWAQYNSAPYVWTPSDLSPIASKLSFVNYAFGFFCPETNATQAYWAKAPLNLCAGKQPFQITFVEDKDPQYIQKLVSFKNKAPQMKLLLSIGGWNFPSRYFSDMVATKESRATFIKSCQQYMANYGFDGIDLDWEYPCSSSRSNPVKITCSDFQMVKDDGGRCPQDKSNLLSLVKEMREALSEHAVITIAAQAAMDKATQGFDLSEMSQYINRWNLMSYDYSTPDEGEAAKITAPNMPLYTPQISGIPPWSIDYTVKGYLAAGVPAKKLVVGLALYGHTWYTPTVSDASAWQKFGVKATKQNKCCGVENDTYGAKGGKGQGECGSMMYSEILAANCSSYQDTNTMSTIAFCGGAGRSAQDGYTADGTWISYNNEDSFTAIADYVKSKDLGGAFVFDASMDTRSSSGACTYKIMNLVSDMLL